ncbi:hypothetical protein MACJ_001481 [Theileria orientalis]|uniref:ABM domain-containing protein n=1 Tax=Theileria orientalis TaxID=68886 RepID=A0A976M8G8_THEOR|nr:hypothetical protein MACJ_001481 [Theileria orientalis]
MSRIRVLDNLKEMILDVFDWYKYATLKQQHLTMMFTGGVLGLITGRIQRKRRIKAGEFSKDFEIVGYNVKNESEFERNWTKLARLAQKQPGYKYTKLYKAVYMDKSPVHYFKLRLWRNKDDIIKFRNSPEYKELRKKVDDNATEVQFGTTSVVLDDSIRREIPYTNFYIW